MSLWLALALLLGTVYLFWRRSGRIGTLEGKAIFITGCDTGFGRLMALKYCKEGARVFAACLTKDASETLSGEATGKGRISTVLLDVTDAGQVQSAYEYVRSELEKEKKPLYALINNAGIAAGWYVEMTTVDEYKRVMDINFMGCVQVTKAFLPLIQQPGGRIVTIVSCASLAAAKGFSAYAASKYAQNAFLDSLRRELVYCGIHVVKVMPGFFATPMVQNNYAENKWHTRLEAASESVRKRYPPSLASSSKAGGDAVLKFAQNPDVVVQSIEDVLLRVKPPVRVLLGYDAHLVMWPLSLLPDALHDLVSSFGGDI